MAKNILLLIADDLGKDTTYLGNTAAVTPNLDRLGSEGVCFDQAFCTTATCSASRSVIFTGLHNHQTGHYGHCHSFHHFMTFSHVETAPAILGDAGYLTAIIGKIHVGPEEVYPWEIRNEGFRRNRDVRSMSQTAGEIFRTAGDRPFFLSVGFGDTHRDGTRKGFANRDYPGVVRRRFAPGDVPVPAFLPDIPEVREELAEYYESAHRLDQGVGLVLAELEQAGHAEDTLVMFVSDNGIPFVGSKTTLYEPGIELPMFLKAPGVKAGVRNPNMVSYVDILPTFLEWAGVERPGLARPGRSLLSICEQTVAQPEWAHIFCSHTFHEVTNYYPTRVLRTSRYKYHKNVVWKTDFPFASDLYASLTWEGVRRMKQPKLGRRPVADYIRRPHEELYDLDNDPDEIENLASRSDYRHVLEEMRAKVEAWQTETKDPWLYRDGVSLLGLRHYAEEGLEIPDRHDMGY